MVENQINGMKFNQIFIFLITEWMVAPAMAYYQPESGRFMQRDTLGVNPAEGKQNPFAVQRQYLDGMSMYLYTKNNPIRYHDPLGNSIYYCYTKTGFGIPGMHHAYIWDDTQRHMNPDGTETKGQSCGMDGSSKSIGLGENNGYPDGGEGGPSIDNCTKIKGSDGKESCMMEWCKKNARSGPWLPFINDCHNKTERAASNCGLGWPMKDENGKTIIPRRVF